MKNKITQLQTFIIIFLLITIAFLLNNKNRNNIEEVIYTKGIVIVDEKGNDRILIGSPIPKSKNRLRTDLDRVKEFYGKDFPPEVNFMNIYKSNINNNVNGILILDEKGIDKLALGDPVPDLYFGPRIGPSTGIVINDSIGLERSGYGLINTKDGYRVNLGFDTNQGTEGMTLSLNDDGNTYFNIGSDIILGKLPAKNYFTKDLKFQGIKIKDKDSVYLNVNTIK